MDGLLQQTSAQSKHLRTLLRRSIPSKVTAVEQVPAPAFAKAHLSMTRQQKEGKRFERALAKWLGSRTTAPILSQTWLKYSDASGEGWASPDLIIPRERLLIECKRTYTAEADAQLLLVYAPLVEMVWPGGGWRLVVAVKNWAGEAKPLVLSPLQAAQGLNYYIHRS